MGVVDGFKMDAKLDGVINSWCQNISEGYGWPLEVFELHKLLVAISIFIQ